MIVSAHQPAYNPWLGFIHKILISDIFVVMDDVQFEKNSFINRNKILQNNHEVMLTIPIKTKDYKDRTLKEMEISDHRWKIKHLKSIEQAYKKSKNFESILEKLKPIYEIQSDFLIDYTNAYLNFIVEYLMLDTQIIFASDLNITSKKLDYVCELTKKVDGKVFVFGSQGKNYADVDYLNERNIIPYFQSYQHPIYQQDSEQFHPYIGVIDLLFNEDPSIVKSVIVKHNITKNEIRGA